ncbi:LLM class flavin-dependent oxidoreductase [Conexibacter sp. CPCC 206217]|uniref:LLM class flavin-dependent oxidoreductase n=1 Tax=Conexibacter sp. CPCC 206217 TaxID=3064574 RepID=UPI002718C92F|nr:LLM class flavin-dependent oxidoreductase [Conexibacter sp. CPCC 206217]MDO8212306.1 LLM class flavin-dependent oxidoreductase [Conexibacter sp. CPCC 206217]
MDRAPLGISVFAPELRQTVALAAAADQAGIDVWTSELFNRTATVPLAVAAHVTSRVRIGSSVMYGVGRSPLMLAAEARDLDQLSGGRFVLGLGNGTRRMISDWHGLDPAAPALRMEELIPLLRRLFRLHLEPVIHSGRFYSVKVHPIADGAPPLREQVPIVTGGVSPRMIESAGRVADGFIGHPIMSADYLDAVVRPALQRGAAATGRALAEERFELAAMVLCSANDDERTARLDAASQLAFYGTVKSYDSAFDHHGFGAETTAIRTAFRAGDLDAMRAAVSDRMIDTLAIAGTPEDVAARLWARSAALDHLIVSGPTNGVPAERVEANLRGLIAVLGEDQYARTAIPG